MKTRSCTTAYEHNSQDERSLSTVKVNLNGESAVHYVWWNQEGISGHEFLRRVQTVTTDFYFTQLTKVDHVLQEKRQKFAFSQV
ncbi:hypothetical protein M514_19007 [Trichuris suis]|uniref:Uncharacterized protein n=1 Tax=Trichuris suis TaxID=68888 RepID=A0A085NH20_9BILA|nr:hypothetical protein M514_19007 [Trichuris suis]